VRAVLVKVFWMGPNMLLFSPLRAESARHSVAQPPPSFFFSSTLPTNCCDIAMLLDHQEAYVE